VTLPEHTKGGEDDPPVAAPGPMADALPQGEDLQYGERPSLLPGSAEHVEAPARPAEPAPGEVATPEKEAWPPPPALWIETGVMLLVTTVPYAFYAIWFHWLPDPQALPFAFLNVASILDSASVIALGLYVIYRSQEPLEDFGIVKPSRWDIPGGILVMAADWSTYALAIQPFFLRFLPDASRYSERISAFFPRPESPSQYCLLALSCASVGLAEEIIYRGYLLPRLGRLTGSDGAGLILGTVIFALMHVYQGPHGVISAAWFGLVTGALFLVTRRIWPFAFAHALGNFIGIGWQE
jgi:membrane protease YdiL (CAAX protease family)